MRKKSECESRAMSSWCCLCRAIVVFARMLFGLIDQRAVMKSNARAHCVLMTPWLPSRQTQSFQLQTPAGPRAAGT